MGEMVCQAKEGGREGGREGDVLDFVAHEEAHGLDALPRPVHVVAWREEGREGEKEGQEMYGELLPER